MLEGANIPIAPSAEKALHVRGIWVVPDFVANAGGVICAAMELQGGGKARAFESIQEKCSAHTAAALSRARERGCTPRAAAEELALERIRSAMKMRRFSLG